MKPGPADGGRGGEGSALFAQVKGPCDQIGDLAGRHVEALGEGHRGRGLDVASGLRLGVR